jgi:hypothetical protein
MRIKRQDLQILIKQILLETDLDYISPLRYFVDKNPRLKEFKTEVFRQLNDVYEKKPGAEFFGIMSRDVARVVKSIYNDPSYGFTDRGFLQNEVKNLHYISFVNIDNFLSEATANSKNEISTVGYMDSDKMQTGAFGKSVAIQLEGYVTYAANTNLVSGMSPSKATLEKYKSSGVPKFLDNDIAHAATNMQLLFTLTNHINFVLDNTILDYDTFISAKERTSSIVPMRKGHIATAWNEFILDNWKPVGLMIDEKSEKNPKIFKIIKQRIPQLADKYNLPIVTL